MGSAHSHQIGGRGGYEKKYILPMVVVMDIIQESKNQTREHGYIFEKKSFTEYSLQRTLVGKEENVTIPGVHAVSGHTHPPYIYGDLKFHPPSGSDYVQSIWDCVQGAEINIVFEPSGFWVYRPNLALMKYIAEKQPNIADILGPPLREGEEKRTINGVSDDLFDLVDTIHGNTDSSNIALSQPPELIRQIRQDNNGVLPEGFAPITKKKYLEEIGMCVDGDKMGFDVQYFAMMDFDAPTKTYIINIPHKTFALLLQ